MAKRYNIDDHIPYHQDKGCKFAPSCLSCPFSKCIYDEVGGEKGWLERQRNKEIIRLFKEGKSIKELMVMFGVSERIVRRVLRGK